jgi:hypothetical protein
MSATRCPLGGEPAGLLHRQPGLAGARAPGDLHAVPAGEEVEHPGLVPGEQVAGRLPLGEPGHQGLLRDRRPGQAIDEILDLFGGGRVRLVADLLQRRADACGGVREVGPVERHPARETRSPEVGRQRGRRQGDEMGQARTAPGPAGVLLEVVAEQVLAGDGLVDRVDLVVDAVPDLAPDPALQRHAAALDLDDGDAHARPGDDQVGLAVLCPGR